MELANQTQEQIYNTNRRLSGIMLKPLLLLSRQRNSKVNEYGEKIKLGRPTNKKELQCCNCRKIFLKVNMTLHKYKVSRFKDKKYRNVFVKKYYCKECQDKFIEKPR
jgi:hypothetical protein